MEYRCPVCNEVLNTEGKPFVSEHAMAMHVAGKVKRARDYAHTGWLEGILPELDYENSRPDEIGYEIGKWMGQQRIVGRLKL